VNKFLKALLRTGVYFLDQANDVPAIRNRVDGFTDRASRAMRSGADYVGGREDHGVRNAITFAAGVGLGVGLGLLFAPASGTDTRELITAKVQDLSQGIRERFSSETSEPGTGTDGA
jgi:hypothetical protein